MSCELPYGWLPGPFPKLLAEWTPVRSRVLKNLRAHRAALMARANALLREGAKDYM